MKIIRIDACRECKHAGAIYCNHPKGPKGVVPYDYIHPDCPLEDAEKWNMGDVIENNPQLYKDAEDLTEIREKAAKWDKVKEIAAVCPVSGCPVYHDCNRDCLMYKIVDAIEGTKEKTNG
jgi:hypothetical protein